MAHTISLGLVTRYGFHLHTGTVINQIMNVLEAWKIDGATIRECTGVWKGAREPSLEIYVSGVDGDTIRYVAVSLRNRFMQESVGLRESPEMEIV